VGAYVVACQICGADTGAAVAPQDAVAKISFETMEDVDDINVHLKDGGTIYIQAKAIISFSVSAGGELRSVLDQFHRQTRRPGDRLLLITTSRSSKKVTYDLRSALEAYRHAEEEAFYKTQPTALSGIIDEVKVTLHSLGVQGDITQIIKAMSVIVLDIEENDPLDQAMVLIIQSHRFIAPRAVWGKLISDCLTFSKSRRTIDVAEVAKSHERFLGGNAGPDADTADELIKIKIEGSFSAGREVVLCESDGSSKVFPEGLCIIEFYRFDDDCNERIRISDDQVTLGNGSTLKLLRRSATFEGMTRLAKRNEAPFQEREVIIMPGNLPDDIEESTCAKMHHERIERAITLNTTPLACLHCGKPVFSSSAHVVELAPSDAPVVGLTHDECLQPADRILGMIKNEMFDSYSELIDFDVTGWFKALHGGQMVFANADYLANSQQANILWSGDEAKGPLGHYVVEISLLNGEREIISKRNGVHRFSKEGADAFAERLNTLFAERRAEADPFCYSDESKTFGPKSQVLSLLGIKEKLRPVDQARTRRYDAAFADRFSRPGHWYAPLLYLRNSVTGEPVSEQNTVFLLTDPLALKAYLENWREAQIDVGEYRTEALLTDSEFDDFMRWNEGRDFSAIVNPVLDPAIAALTSGRPVISSDLLSRL